MKLDSKKTAVLTLDFQAGILGSNAGAEAIITEAAKAVAFARAQGFHLIHVGLGFSPGYPEIPPSVGMPFKRLMDQGLFLKGSESAAFHPEVYRTDDLIVHKQRFGAFSENKLHLILRAQSITHLVLFGVSTSGIVLTTLRQAFDLDFHCTVLKDACYDSDPEIHRVLTEKIFPKQATVITVDAFLAEQKATA